MGAKIASFLATLLLSIPLAAIGLMAVFGVPQLLPAGPERDQVVRNLQKAFNWRTDSETAQTNAEPAYEDAVPFGQNANAPSQANGEIDSGNQQHFSQTGNQNQVGGPFSSTGQFAEGSRSLNENAPSQGNNNPRNNPSWVTGGNPQNGASSASTMAMAPPAQITQNPFSNRSANNGPVHAGGTPSSSHNPTFNGATGNGAIANGLTMSWRQASARLTELGIKNYHLERGAIDGTFLFVCLYSPPEAPQVTHRFESEADDPLVAVNQVLKQVNGWMQTRVNQSVLSGSEPSGRTPNSSFTSGVQYIR